MWKAIAPGIVPGNQARNVVAVKHVKGTYKNMIHVHLNIDICTYYISLCASFLCFVYYKKRLGYCFLFKFKKHCSTALDLFQ